MDLLVGFVVGALCGFALGLIVGLELAHTFQAWKAKKRK